MRRWLLLLVAVAVVAWVAVPPGWAPLSRLSGLPASGAECRLQTSYGRVCRWYGDSSVRSEHTVTSDPQTNRAEMVRHQWWWVGDSLEWRRVGDSVQAALAALRARPIPCERMLRQNGSWGQRFAMRGYEVQYYEYRWPVQSDSVRVGQMRLGVELYGGSGVPPCEVGSSAPRLMTLGEVEDALGRLIARALGLLP